MSTGLEDYLPEYTFFNDEQSIDDFLYAIDDFHDSACREIKLLFDNCVYKNAVMSDIAGYNIRLLFHSQFIHECPAFDILFLKVHYFRMENMDCGHAIFDLKKNDDLVCLEAAIGKLRIEAEVACYRMLAINQLPDRQEALDGEEYLLDAIEKLPGN